MQNVSLVKEKFAQISQDVLRDTLRNLGQDSSLLEDEIFQYDVEDEYTLIKKEAFSTDVWSFTKVLNYTLQEMINPVTGNKQRFLPSDFIALIYGYNKQSNFYQIYNTSLINLNNLPAQISYIRYVYDNDPNQKIPDYFQKYIANKLAFKLTNSNRYSVTSTNVNQLQLEIGITKMNALKMDRLQNPFGAGFNYSV